jgi:hypothetical protein
VSKVSQPTTSVAAANSDITDVAKRGLGGDLLESYLKAAKNSADVVMNEDLWRKISGASTTQ